MRLDTARHARATQRLHQAKLCGDADGWSSVQGVEGSLGLGFGLPLHPKTVVTFVRGPYLFVAELFSLGTPPVDILNEFVRSMDRVTTATG